MPTISFTKKELEAILKELFYARFWKKEHMTIRAKISRAGVKDFPKYKMR